MSLNTQWKESKAKRIVTYLLQYTGPGGPAAVGGGANREAGCRGATRDTDRRDQREQKSAAAARRQLAARDLHQPGQHVRQHRADRNPGQHEIKRQRRDGQAVPSSSHWRGREQAPGRISAGSETRGDPVLRSSRHGNGELDVSVLPYKLRGGVHLFPEKSAAGPYTAASFDKYYCNANQERVRLRLHWDLREGQAALLLSNLH